jgi:predicted porin
VIVTSHRSSRYFASAASTNFVACLLASTALTVVDVAPAQAQNRTRPVEVAIGGFYGQYLSYIHQDDVTSAGVPGTPARFDVSSDSEIHFNGRATLDNGVVVGFRVELEGATDSDQIDESYLFVETRFGRIEMGAINNAAYRMHYEAPEAFSRGWLTDDGNLTNNVINPTTSASLDSAIIGTQNRFFDNDSDKITYYTPRLEGFQVGLSYVPESSQDRNVPAQESIAYSRGFAVGANFVRNLGGVDVAASLGYFTWQGPPGAPDPDAYQGGLRLAYAGFTFGGSYARIIGGRSGSAGTNASASTAGTGLNRVEGRAWNIGGMYTFGPASVSLTYANGRNDSSPAAGPSFGDDKFSGLSLGGKYVIGPGVSLEGVLFRAEFDGNGSAGSPDSNKATGVVMGLLMNF